MAELRPHANDNRQLVGQLCHWHNILSQAAISRLPAVQPWDEPNGRFPFQRMDLDISLADVASQKLIEGIQQGLGMLDAHSAQWQRWNITFHSRSSVLASIVIASITDRSPSSRSAWKRPK